MSCLTGTAPTMCEASEREVRHYLVLGGLTGLLWLACEGAARCGLGKSPLGLVQQYDSSWSLIAFASAALFFAMTRPSSWALILLLATALGATFGMMAFARLVGAKPVMSSALAIGLGASGLGMLAHRCWISTGPARTEALALLFPAILVPVFNALNMYFLLLTVQLCPTTYDAQLYAADAALGVQPSFLMGQLLVAVPLLRYTAMTVYMTLPMTFLALLLLQLRVGRDRLPAGSVFWPFLVAGLAGFWLYILFPAAGPAVVFSATFPDSPPTVGEVLSAPLTIPSTVRNCMPSLHTTWALLLWWHSRPLGRSLRFVTAFYLVFTMIAALGYGEHYLFDLVVAFPFALSVQAACTPSAVGRIRIVVFAVALTVAWLLVLAFALPLLNFSVVLTWSAVTMTAIGCLLIECRLDRQASTLLGSRGIVVISQRPDEVTTQTPSLREVPELTPALEGASLASNAAGA